MARRSEADDLAIVLALNYRTMAIVIGEGLLPFWNLGNRACTTTATVGEESYQKMTRDPLYLQLSARLVSGATFSPLSITTHVPSLIVTLGCGSKSSKTLGCKSVKGKFISLRSLSLFSRFC
jgi:hypothetical protein